MPWSEDEFRRALEGAAERVRPTPDALGILRARAHRRDRVRTFSYAFAGAAAAVVLIAVGLSLRPTPARQDIELAGPSRAGTTTASAPPVVREEADGGSILPDISGDGRYVAFMSESAGLVPGDTNGVSDTFVRDLSTGTITRVSVSSNGEQGNGASLSAAISREGRFVAFRSDASNLVLGDTNGTSDVFLRDRSRGTTTRVSVGSGGAQADGASDSASISADGRFIAFRSMATNLVKGDTNAQPDIFVHNVTTGSTTRVSLSSDGAQTNADSRNPQISADGSRIVFSSIASTLVGGDTNRTWDVFVHDLSAGSTDRASVSSDEAQANLASVFPSISGDGRFVAFVSPASNLVAGDTNRSRDIFLRDLAAGTTERVSTASDGTQANGASLSVSLSGDGGIVAFSSNASNLVPGDRNQHRDVFVKNRSTGAVTLISRSSAAASGDGDSGGPTISADGRLVAFQSYATTLGAGDENRLIDVFVADLTNRTTSRVSGGRSR